MEMARRNPVQASPSTTAAADARLYFGCAALDARLESGGRGGGLPRAALHEFGVVSDDDAASAAALALGLAARASGGGDGTILWLRDLAEPGRGGTGGGLYGPGLAELGINPARVLLIDAPGHLAQLRAAADIARCRAGAVLVLALGPHAPPLDLTATRRLALAAEQSGTPVLLLSPARHAAAGPDRAVFAAPSAAFSRWQVASAPSPARHYPAAPGPPAFALSLCRHRGGVSPFVWTVEWNRDQRACISPHPADQPPLSGAVFAVAGGRGVGDGGTADGAAGGAGWRRQHAA